MKPKLYSLGVVPADVLLQRFPERMVIRVLIFTSQAEEVYTSIWFHFIIKCGTSTPILGHRKSLDAAFLLYQSTFFVNGGDDGSRTRVQTRISNEAYSLSHV